jgi:hypothetical protein
VTYKAFSMQCQILSWSNLTTTGIFINIGSPEKYDMIKGKKLQIIFEALNQAKRDNCEAVKSHIKLKRVLILRRICKFLWKKDISPFEGKLQIKESASVHRSPYD